MPFGSDVPAVFQVALVAIRNVADRPAISGSSFSVIWPSWFGEHSAFDPSTPPSPCPGGASTGEGPQVPSALQKWELQSSSTAQVWPLGPPHAASAANPMLQSSKEQAPWRDFMGG